MLIEYKNVSIYQADKCILKDVNFHVDEGEFTYLIGKVGSGKSSLLKTLYCELDLVEGETEKAEILGRDLTTIRRKDIPALRKELGIIFQDFQLLHDRSVHKNFEFVLKATGWKDKKARNERISEVLEEVGMSEKADKMPHELSGGEQQRIAEPGVRAHGGGDKDKKAEKLCPRVQPVQDRCAGGELPGQVFPHGRPPPFARSTAASSAS